MNTTGVSSVLLTGATSGLGLRVAHELVDSEQWTVLATARSESKISELDNVLGKPTNFRYVVCNQADFSSIRQAGKEISRIIGSGEMPPLRGVALNAGIQTGSTSTATVDGLELTFATNVAGPHLLLGLLSSLLEPTSRILQTGSGTHYGRFRRSYGMVAKPRWQAPAALAAPRAGDGIEAYSTSKLSTLYSTHELSRRAPDNIVPVCYDPGMLPGTGLARDRSAVERFAWKYFLPAMRLVPGVSTPARSAVALAAIATGGGAFSDKELRGSYIEIDHSVPSSPESYDPARERELFDFLDTATGLTADDTADWWSRNP